MARAGYSCFTPDFALIKEDLLCFTPVWKEWEHHSVPEAAREHPPARATYQQNKSFLQPWTGQLRHITAWSEINLAAAICAKASPTGAAAEKQELLIMLIAPGLAGLQMVLDQLKGWLGPPATHIRVPLCPRPLLLLLLANVHGQARVPVVLRCCGHRSRQQFLPWRACTVNESRQTQAAGWD